MYLEHLNDIVSFLSKTTVIVFDNNNKHNLSEIRVSLKFEYRNYNIYVDACVLKIDD